MICLEWRSIRSATGSFRRKSRNCSGKFASTGRIIKCYVLPSKAHSLFPQTCQCHYPVVQRGHNPVLKSSALSDTDPVNNHYHYQEVPWGPTPCPPKLPTLRLRPSRQPNPTGLSSEIRDGSTWERQNLQVDN